MDNLSIINETHLPHLKKLYEIDKPLHVVTTVAIGHFIKRFASKPEWTKIVTFWSLNDNNWKETGTFVMINANDDHILFNTLEPSPYPSLCKALTLIDYTDSMVFISFREIFRPVIFNTINEKKLEILFDCRTRNIYYEVLGDGLDEFAIKPPDGFYFGSLEQSHMEQILSTFNQEYFLHPERSLANCIAHNPSTGLFDKETGELAAWTLMLDTGVAGNLYVVNKYRRHGFGELVTMMQTCKVNKHGYDITGHHIYHNNAVFHLHSKMGGQYIDNNSWIGIRPKKLNSLKNRL